MARRQSNQKQETQAESVELKALFSTLWSINKLIGCNLEADSKNRAGQVQTAAA